MCLSGWLLLLGARVEICVHEEHVVVVKHAFKVEVMPRVRAVVQAESYDFLLILTNLVSKRSLDQRFLLPERCSS